jgi:hypothetical protein
MLAIWPSLALRMKDYAITARNLAISPPTALILKPLRLNSAMAVRDLVMSRQIALIPLIALELVIIVVNPDTWPSIVLIRLLVDLQHAIIAEDPIIWLEIVLTLQSNVMLVEILAIL